MTSVSASLIVRNEEHFLRNCLISLRSAVDEIVVVDTGSTDSSVRIAEECGARLVHFAWSGSFAEARNRGLEECRSDWILYIDADECLSLDPGVRLQSQLENGWAAAWVKFRPKSGYTRYWEFRLFRCDPSIRFEGRIHETSMPSAQAYANTHGLRIGRVNVSLNHFGYDGDQSHKHPRNLPLLLASVAENPMRPYFWYHLTETYAAMGQLETALEVGERGLLVLGDDFGEKELADVNLLAQAVTRLRLDANRDPSDLIEAALDRVPDDHAMQFIKARWLIRQGQPREAIALLDRLTSIDAGRLEPGHMAFDERIFGTFAIELKAAALVQLGDLAGAGAMMSRARSA